MELLNCWKCNHLHWNTIGVITLLLYKYVVSSFRVSFTWSLRRIQRHNLTDLTYVWFLILFSKVSTASAFSSVGIKWDKFQAFFWQKLKISNSIGFRLKIQFTMKTIHTLPKVYMAKWQLSSFCVIRSWWALLAMVAGRRTTQMLVFR